MHREFRELLTEATGESQYVLAVNVDIRGFSPFSKTVESPDTAIFIKRVYITLIDKYFPNASFFKPTGDGLLVTIPYDDKSLKKVVQATVNTCLNVVQDFPEFCHDDPMINFATPQKIGIGISRGTVCCLVSNSKILDYSGRVVNLASRLMDIARPSGVVFDASLGIDLLSEEQAKLFEKDTIYVRGVAESEPITIYYTKDLTQISALNKQSLDEIKWESSREEVTIRQMKAMPRFRYKLAQKPLDPTQIMLRVSWRYPSMRRRKGKEVVYTWHDFDVSSKVFNYYLDKGFPALMVEYAQILNTPRIKELKDSTQISIEISYPVKPS